MKVRMFIELVSGVKYPKITTVGLFLSDHLWMFCRRAVLSLLFFYFTFCGILLYFFVSGMFLFVLWETSCVNFFLPVFGEQG